MQKSFFTFILVLSSFASAAQDYFLKKYQPFDSKIPSPEAFLGYPIGSQHTRHDQIVYYLKELASLSDNASYYEYGKTHEGRKLVILTISSNENIKNLNKLQEQHLAFTDATKSPTNYDEVPVFVNLGYNVHGNEPSSSEAALLTAYTLVASNHPEIRKYRSGAVVFIDPTINPDGRDRHTQWANSYKGSPLVSDPIDAEHNEYWPGGRTNHYWFDLNRDWLLAVNPESQSKLNWYHKWYPNVVTDFHEMGTNSTYFFEPAKPNGSKKPIIPKENYETLNNLFGDYFSKALDSIGSLYFTKEVFDNTYPGYGSSYPDIQGGLALLFEQASSRGHVQNTSYGKITFPFTIRNHYTSSLTTVKASVENTALLRKYQQDFFKDNARNTVKNEVANYIFGDDFDKNRVKAFIDQLLLHRIKVYKSNDANKYIVPVKQAQKKMVQTMFETYKEYRDSVFYDASAWSVANFYNMKYKGIKNKISLGDEITSTKNLISVRPVTKSNYAYIIDYNDYNAPAGLYYLQENGVHIASAFKTFSIATDNGNKTFNYGSLIIPVSKQKISNDSLFSLLQKVQNTYQLSIHGVKTGYSLKGIDLGSNSVRYVRKPKIAMLIGTGTRSYEAGEVWHLLDTRMQMPITKIPIRNFSRVNMDTYNTLVMVSGNYNGLNSNQKKKIKDWTTKGNTLITIGSASKWAIDTKLVNEKFITAKDSSSTAERKSYVDASENLGKDRVGGAIFNVAIDITHPLAFGYSDTTIPVYKNNSIWLAPSKNSYATVTKYTENPHIDGFITEKNLNEFLKPAASLIVSPVGSGRAVMFANNPNFRGAWYGTNRLFLNALFLGNHIRILR